VYKPPAIIAPSENLPDEYFTPTLADLKERQEQLHARTTTLSNAPLLTRVQREQQTKAKRDRWPNTTIRVRFLDRTQLEKTFPSSSKIRAVYAFVRDCLREDVKPIKFILSSNPPPRDLKVSDPDVRDRSLTGLGLAPSSVLLIRFVDDALNHSNVPAPLASAVLERAVELPAPPSFDGDRKKDVQSSVATSSKGKKGSSGEAKVPKWLKLGPKK
jgi:tether containing UBX domain for GLUT4